MRLYLSGTEETFGRDDTSPEEVCIIPLDNEVNPYDLAVADFDGNGLLDIAIAKRDGSLRLCGG